MSFFNFGGFRRVVKCGGMVLLALFLSWLQLLGPFHPSGEVDSSEPGLFGAKADLMDASLAFSTGACSRLERRMLTFFGQQMFFEAEAIRRTRWYSFTAPQPQTGFLLLISSVRQPEAIAPSPPDRCR